MRKMGRLSLGIAGSVALLSTVLFLLTDVRTLDPDEQLKLKEGKDFWEWVTPQGTFSMHYVQKGEGKDHILLIHGFRAHTYTWRHLMDPLVKAGYHVWAIDLIGYGLSDKPTHLAYTADFFVEQIKAFMEAHAISQAHVIGNSMGGGIALSLSITHPEKTRSLTLLSALGYPLDMPLYLSLGRHISQLWAPFLGPRMIRYGLKKIVFDPDLVGEEQVEAYSLPYRFPGGITSSLLTLKEFDNQRLVEMGKHYPHLQQPLLVIWGEKDTLIPVSHYEKFLNDFPKANCLLLPSCGHLPQEEYPEEVVQAISSFLTEHFP